MNLSGEHGDEYTILFLGSSLISVEIDGRMIGIAIVVRRGLASPVCVLLSCDQESKQRSPAQSPRWLVPWTAVQSSRARAPGCEESPHPPSSSAGKAFRPVRDAMCLSRGPDQHPLGGDTAALLVAAFPRALSRGQRSTALITTKSLFYKLRNALRSPLGSARGRCFGLT